jgi:carboxylesterase
MVDGFTEEPPASRNTGKNETLYAKGKNGTAVLILHGYTSHITQTDILFQYLKKKGFTVYRPIMPGHDGKLEDLLYYGPHDWFEKAQDTLNRILQESREVYIVGMSFGGNIGVTLCNLEPNRIKGLVTMEMPLQFIPRIRFYITCIQPIFQLLNIKYIKKDTFFYRRRHPLHERNEVASVLPIRIMGMIRDYIQRKTKKELESLSNPCLLIQAQRSNLLSSRNAQLIYQITPASHKRLYLANVDNHDLNLMDEPGKMLMLEEIYEFINRLSVAHKTKNV